MVRPKLFLICLVFKWWADLPVNKAAASSLGMLTLKYFEKWDCGGDFPVHYLI